MNYLFPNKYRKIGWIFLFPTIVLGLITMMFNIEPEFLDWRVPAIWAENIVIGTNSNSGDFFAFIENNVLNEFLGILLVVSSLVVAFSKEKTEDELISKVRLESLVWAVYLNYGILLLSILFIYDLSFFWIMIFNMFTILWFFIIRYQWQMIKLKKAVSHEE